MKKEVECKIVLRHKETEVSETLSFCIEKYEVILKCGDIEIKLPILAEDTVVNTAQLHITQPLLTSEYRRIVPCKEKIEKLAEKIAGGNLTL